ncbi:MAG TPA: hypothetical protein VHC95_01390 [Opitutales bacterium]|nr:hypothetical protein [Opitutales bacterium]
MDVEELKFFHQLSPAEQDNYHFKRSAHPTAYDANPIGYVYLIALAKLLFPFVGDQKAIVLLQMLVHAALCAWVFFSPSFPPKFKLGFFFLYALNPVALGFATFNYYYLWQAVPSFFVLYLWHERRIYLGGVLLLALATGLALAARPTPMLLVPVLAWLTYQRLGWKGAVAMLLVLGAVFAAVYRPTQKNIFHVAYLGVGAYANPDHIQISDTDVYALYESKTGEKLDPSIGGNFYQPAVMARYHQVTREGYLAEARAHPLLLARNTVLNIAQSYLLGYQTRCGDWLNYIVAGLGAAFAAWLAWRRRWFYLVVIPLASLTFTPYYPPIRAYMYGAYSLIVFALLAGLRLIESSPPQNFPLHPGTKPENSPKRQWL